MEKWTEFTDSRERLLAEDIANISTPNYQQKDMSVEGFQNDTQPTPYRKKTTAAPEQR